MAGRGNAKWSKGWRCPQEAILPSHSNSFTEVPVDWHDTHVPGMTDMKPTHSLVRWKAEEEEEEVEEVGMTLHPTSIINTNDLCPERRAGIPMDATNCMALCICNTLKANNNSFSTLIGWFECVPIIK